MNFVDSLLNRFTMYKVVMYGLFLLALYSLFLSFLGQLSFNPLELTVTFLVLIFTCYYSNLLFAKLFKVFPNSESSIITGTILFFLLWPSYLPKDIVLMLAASVIAMGSKYLVNFKGKHLFNPAAFAAIALLFFNSGAVWWVATLPMLPAVLLIGLLIVRKIRRFTLFLTFLAVSTSTILLFTLSQGRNVPEHLNLFLVSFPVLFFATVMLTEPATTPPSKKLQMIYASIVGFLFSLQTPIGPVYPSPEAALLVGNIFSFVVSPKYKFKLKLIEKIEIAKDTIELVLEKPNGFKFLSGQFFEWTIPMTKADLRGNRRYFTISSSPTEDKIRLGIKINNPSSSFKKHLQALKKGDILTAGNLSGDFTLKNQKKNLVFIAGGIGITPFRSLIKNLLDERDERKITLFYSNKTAEEIAYQDLLGEASQKIDLKVVYVLTEEKEIPKNFNGEKGRISEQILKKYIKNLGDCDYYLSGPIAMVNGYKKLLLSLGVRRNSIYTDYFPGF